MSQSTNLTPLESAFAGLAPSAAGLNRDRVIFEAGRAAARSRPWPALTVAFAALSVALGVQLMQKPKVLPSNHDVVVQPLPSVPVAEVGSGPSTIAVSNEAKWGFSFNPSAGYLSRRDRALHFGADALPPPPKVPAPSETPQDLKSLHESIKSS